VDDRVDILRRGYSALEHGDFATAMMDFHPDVLVEDHEYSLASPSIQRGHEGFLRIFAAVNEGFEDVRYTPVEFTAVSSMMLVKASRTGRGKSSGVDVQEMQWHVFDFKDGQIVHFRSFLVEDHALRAVGLPSFTNQPDP
jgi:ketosteroid isomerase-like protein